MCLFVILASAGPRVAVFALWAFTSRIGDAFENPSIAILGFLIAPWTTLLYAIVGVDGDVGAMGILALLLGAFMDVSSIASGVRGTLSRGR